MTKKFGVSAVTIALSVSLMSASAVAADIYNTDQGHTEVRLGWSHAGVSMQHAEFTSVQGTLSLDADQVENSSIVVTIETNSLSTGFGPLDTHIKSADFLEVETYPEITFTSTSVSKTGDSTADITGDLTMHGVTLPVTLNATLLHHGEHPLGEYIDYYKGQWAAFTATTVIANHQDFGVGPYSTGPLTIEITTEMKAPE